MHAIISKLDSETSAAVKRLWEILFEECGLSAIYSLPTPHVTWFAAEAMDIEKTVPILSQIASNTDDFQVHTFGLGIFTGVQPILYLPMVKTLEMIHLHDLFWDQMVPFSQEPKKYYSPRLWVPHITIALRDLTHQKLSCAIEAIGREPIELFININNLIIAETTDDNIGKLHCEFTFNQQNSQECA